jgi:hypothetical protein
MNLAQAITLIDSGSYFSRSREEVIAALNEGSRRLYNWTVKEQKGFFLKWDTTKTLIPTVQEIAMNLDLQRIVRITEFDATSGKYRIIHSTDFNSISRDRNTSSDLPFVDFDFEDSPYSFYGPYEKDDAIFYVLIEPPTDTNRALEIVYAAHFVEIVDPDVDYWMIPENARSAVVDYAISELLKKNNDDLWETFEGSGNTKRNEYLETIRTLQVQDTPRQEPYL